MSKLDLLAALEAYNAQNYIPVDKVTIPCFDRPERSLLEKELLSKLSKDASYIIRLVLDTPEHLKDLMLKNNGEVHRTVLQDVLSYEGWKPLRREVALKEIKQFITDFYGS